MVFLILVIFLRFHGALLAKIGYLISILLLIPSFGSFLGTWHQIIGQTTLGLNISLIEGITNS